MRSIQLSLACVLFASVFGCDEAAADFDEAFSDNSELRGGPGRPPRFVTGSLWAKCDLSNVDDDDWWGCNGSLGEGLACLRPISDNGLNICAPQTWDPAVADDCSNVTEPFGGGVELLGSAYCVVDCIVDSDCGPGMQCVPSLNFCAWIGD